jgi:hypothetical protein
VDTARDLGRAGARRRTGTGREARGSTEGPDGGRSGRSVFLSGGYGVLSARKRLLLALLDGKYRVVVELAGNTRGRRFLTASSKVSQSTSGRWCGRQGEQSPRAVVTLFCCYSPELCGCRVRRCCTRRARGCSLRLRCGAAGEDSPWKKLGWGGVQGGELLCFLEQGKGDDSRKEWKNEGKSLLSDAAQGHPTACKTSLEGPGGGWA